MKRLDYPPIWLAIFVLIALAVSWLLPWPGGGRWVHFAGTVLVALGLTLTVMAIREMRRAGTTVIPHRQPTALVTGGIFGLSRNPIYLSDALILTGFCLLFGAALSLLTVPVFMTVITRRFILAEEARLREGFGAEFEAWTTRTRRWL